MYAQFFAGAVLAWVVAYVAIGAAFCIAYLSDRRELEHLVFGLYAQALAIHALGSGLAALGRSAAAVHFSVELATAGAVLASVLLLHFALVFAHARSPMRWMRPVYAIGFAVEVANVCGLLVGDILVENSSVAHFASFRSPPLRLQSTPLGIAAAVFCIGCQVAATVLLARTVLAGHRPRQCIAPLIGATIMTGTLVHDTLVANGIIHDFATSPYGGTAFIFLMTGSFVARSATLSKEHAQQSAELKRRSSELRLSYEQLREAQRELTRKEQLAAIGELAAVIAHEIRNPLAVISNAVAALKRKDLEQNDRETLLVILKEESSRLNRLVGDLLRYARPIEPQKELLQVRELIEKTLAAVGARTELAIEVVEEGATDPIWGDPGLLRQVFDNLIDNAIQAMTTSGQKYQTLTIALRSEDREGVRGVCVDVRDSGEGMAPSVQTRAMDPFFTTRPSGTGLGLAIVDRIIDAHDGEIGIRSEPHTGTTVTVFLPVSTAAAPPSSGQIAAIPTSSAPRA